jgi:cytochrome bd-type quinol oxidase subunit 1
LITAGVSIKLMMIVHSLFSQGKLLPIRFLLNCFALYCLVIVIMVGYVPDVVRGDMFEDEFAEYNVQVGVLLFHTVFLALVTSLAFAAWVTLMIRQRAEEGTEQVHGDLSDAMKADIHDDDIAKDTDYVQVL